MNFSLLWHDVGRFIERYNLIVAGGPLAVAGFVRTFIANNKVVNIAVAVSILWLTAKELSGPLFTLLQEQF